MNPKMRAVAKVDRAGMAIYRRLSELSIRVDNSGLSHPRRNQNLLLAPLIKIEAAAFVSHSIRDEVHFAFDPAQDKGELLAEGYHHVAALRPGIVERVLPRGDE